MATEIRDFSLNLSRLDEFRMNVAVSVHSSFGLPQQATAIRTKIRLAPIGKKWHQGSSSSYKRLGTALMDEKLVSRMLTSVWEAAARTNPMLLVKLRPDFSFERLRQMIRDCLAKGLSQATTHYHAVRELMRSATTNQQPRNHCSDLDEVNSPSPKNPNC